MCRWLAYTGTPLRLDTLLLKPERSFIRQSMHAWHSSYAVNGDGFGVGWYGPQATPGIFRDTRPAWNDENLESLAAHIRSHLFLAHIRASSGSPIQRSNCHPFRHGRWLFQHNGEIAGFDQLKRDLDLAIQPELYPYLAGSTDSERLFFLALSCGLEKDPSAALARMAGIVEALGKQHKIRQPLSMTLAAADGERLFAVRYSSSGHSPTLYCTNHLGVVREEDGEEEKLPADVTIILSEPLDQVSEHWQPVPEGTMVVARRGTVELSPFKPAA